MASLGPESIGFDGSVRESSAGDFPIERDRFAEERMIALMRLILASVAELIIFLVPSEPDRHVVLTYTTLTLYSI